MRAFLGGILALVAAGCSTADPCDGLQGTCVSALVDGQPTMLDQLRITAEGQPTSLTTGAGFSLPVRVAIVFTAPPPGPVGITIDGLAGGNVVSSSGKQTVSVPANGKTTFDFHLSPGSVGDGGGGDGSGGDGFGDGGGFDGPPPGVVSFTPSSFNFPDTPRAMKSTMVATITFTNNTTKTVNSTMSTMTGDGNSFNFEPGSTCPMTMGPSPFAPGSSCLLVISFTPIKAGANVLDMTVNWDDGESIMLHLGGNGLRTWANETNPGVGNTLEAVWASGPSDWWVVGHDSMCPLLHSNGNGTFGPDCSGGSITTKNFFSVGGSSATDVWFGGDNGDVWHRDGNDVATHYTFAPAGRFIKGLVAFSATEAYAIDNTSEFWCWGGTSWTACSFQPGTAFTATSLSGYQSSLLAGGAGAQLQLHEAGIMGLVTYSFPMAIQNMNVNGVWYAPVGTVAAGFHYFAVGGNTSSNGMGIFHATEAGPVSEVPNGGATGAMLAVAGRKDPMSPSGLEVWAVGGIGQQVLKSNGVPGASWQQVQVPPAGMGISNHGVWVTDDGQVVAAGDSGQILHFY
jgi:hypothetical protein